MAQSDIFGLTWRVIPDLLGLLDGDGRFAATNPAWGTLLGYAPDEIENRHFTDFIHPEDRPRSSRAFERMSRGTPVLNFVNRYRRKDGGYEWMSWNTVPEDEHFFCSGRCITADRENQAALKTLDEEASLREQFVAVLGHDLRNPLAAINAASRMIGRASDDAQIAELVASIESSTGRIAGLIDDVMDFARSRLGEGLYVCRDREYEMRPILEQAVEEIELANPSVRIEQDYQFMEPVYCDPGRMGQMVSNLLGNAVAHGADGALITLGAADKDNALFIWVRNSGEPIPDEVRPYLFEPFARSAAQRQQEGLGLGLFIAREIAKAHGGDLTVTSDETATEFTFRMPRKVSVPDQV